MMFQFNIQKWILLSLMLSSVVARAGLEDNTDAAAASCSLLDVFPSSMPIEFRQEETDTLLKLVREVPTIAGYVQWSTIECLYNQWAMEQTPNRPMKTAKMLKEHYENNLQKRQQNGLPRADEVRILFQMMIAGYLNEGGQFEVPWSRWANENFSGRTEIDLKEIYAVTEFHTRLRSFFLNEVVRPGQTREEIACWVAIVENINDEIEFVTGELSGRRRFMRADARYRYEIMHGMSGGPGIPIEVLYAREPLFEAPLPVELPADLMPPIPRRDDRW